MLIKSCPARIIGFDILPSFKIRESNEELIDGVYRLENSNFHFCFRNALSDVTMPSSLQDELGVFVFFLGPQMLYFI